jgi:hypothetical protein
VIKEVVRRTKYTRRKKQIEFLYRKKVTKKLQHTKGNAEIAQDDGDKSQVNSNYLA